MGKLGRRQTDCFDMFEKGISIAYEAAESLKRTFGDGVINADELVQIKEKEHEGDKHIHECLWTIEDAFITPINRSDIVEILNGIEDITDSIDTIADHIYMMRFDSSNEYLRTFVDLVVLSCGQLRDLMKALKQYRKDRDKLMTFIIEVNRLENEGDQVYTQSMRELFDGCCERDALKIIKHKELYHLLELTLNRCEDVANNVEKIMISNS